MSIQQDLITAFIEKFTPKQQADIRCFFAPGRVNLIGEHLDYNGGNVFPCAINIGTYAAVTMRLDNKFRVYSENFAHTTAIEFSMDDLHPSKQHLWVNYPKGIIKAFLDNGYLISNGLDIYFYGNIPNGAGLSSSASIEVLTGIILKSYFNISDLSMIQIAQLARSAENDFIGVNCGIMDQFASAMGRQNSAILLNCATFEYKYANLNISGYKLVIGNTMKRRTLSDSMYNKRVSECQTALCKLQTILKIKNLCDIKEEVLLEHQHLIGNPVNYKRVYHAVTENERTLNAFNALGNNDLLYFGQLLKQSHISLRDNYEVTGTELDTMVYAAWEHEACIGSRMTGAGLGGCTISLVKEDAIDDFIAHITTKYTESIKLKPEFYIVSPDAGAREIT